MRCSMCRTALNPSWNLCPFCGTRVSAQSSARVSDPRVTWTAWRLYNRHFGSGLLAYLQDFVLLADGDISELVAAMRPSRFIATLSRLMRELVELSARPELPTAFRAVVLDFASQDHEAMITRRLTPTIAELHAAVRTLIDAGEIDPSLADQIGRYVERSNRADGIAQVASALTGLDSGIARVLGLVVAGLIDNARSNARKDQLGTAWAAMIMAGGEIAEQAWNTLVHKCADAGLLLREAAELTEVDSRAQALQAQLVAHQQSREGEFEQTLSSVHALAREHPHAASVLSVVTHGELLAEVRAQLLGSWLTRPWIGMDESAPARAHQHFLRLHVNDAVIAFFSTTILGQGKAGLVFTTASIQWQIADESPQRLSYAQLRPEKVGWSGSRLRIGAHRLELSSDTDADAAGRVLQACCRLLTVRPGPPECICGAPMHWLVYGPEAMQCPSCKASVGYL